MTTLDFDPRDSIDVILEAVTATAHRRVEHRSEAPSTIAYDTAREAMTHLNANRVRLDLLAELWTHGALCGDEFLDYLDHARLQNPQENRGAHILTGLCQRSIEEYINEEIADA